MLSELAIHPKWALTGLLLFLALGTWWTAHRALKSLRLVPEQRRRTARTLRYLLMTGSVLLVVVIWADELADAALLLGAFAVAIVLSTKELLMCLLGWWLKVMGGHFKVGDLVRVDDRIGEVVDYGLLTTCLHEVDVTGTENHRTGKVITLPNSLYLSQMVVNEPRGFGFGWQNIRFMVPEGRDWQEAEEYLLSAAQQALDGLAERAADEVKHASEHLDVTLAQDPPTVFVKQLEGGQVELELCIGMPSKDKRQTTDVITRRFLDYLAI